MVGPTSTGGQAGKTVINAGGTISGSGLITGGAVVDNGKIISELGLGARWNSRAR